MPLDYAKESCLYFLVKDGEREFIRGKIDRLLEQFRSVQRSRKGR